MERSRFRKLDARPWQWYWGAQNRAIDEETGDEVELVGFLFPHCGSDMTLQDARAVDAIEETLGVTTPGIARWLYVGEDREGVYAVREPHRGVPLRKLWYDSAQRLPHDIRYASYGLSPYPSGEDRTEHIELAPFDVPTTLGIVRDVASIIAALHDEGFAHTSVSLRCVGVHADGVTVHGVGTGLAELRSTFYMGSGSNRGRYPYFTPELVDPGRHDRRSDVFGLGVLLWELLNYTVAFMRSDEIDILHAVREDDLPRCQRVRPAVQAFVDELIADATAKIPGERIRADEFVAALPIHSVSYADLLERLKWPAIHDRIIALRT